MKAPVAICVALWLFAPAPLLLSAIAQVPGVSEAVKVVDIAREKDVVWLSLATTVVAIVFSAWLVYRKDKQTEMITQSQLESAKAIQALVAAVNELRKDLEERPCLHPIDRR